MPSFKSGMSDMLMLNKEIEAEEAGLHSSSKVVKLRFTRKQYDAFRDACKIFELVAADEGFSEHVKKALGADIRTSTIAKQFVNPILEAPMRIPIKIPKPQSSGPKRETYFTAPIDATDKCVRLYAHVAEDVELKQNVKDENTTSVTDVRVMVGKYISTRNLRTEDGVVIDDFLRELVPDAINNNKDIFKRIDGKYVIPKGDKKVMSSIVNEVAFGSF